MPKAYLVTGASSGFGAALTRAVLDRGGNAVLHVRRVDQLREVASDHPNPLANIAGRGSLIVTEEFSPDQPAEQMAVAFCAAELTRAVLPRMREQGSGHILQLTSTRGRVSVGSFSAYYASKYALNGWSQALRDEVGPLGVDVTIVEPGAFRTEFAKAKNMRSADSIDAYCPVIEPVERCLYDGSGRQRGDLARAAQVMIGAVESDDPPLHLVLGQDACDAWKRKLKVMGGDPDAWRERGIATAFPDAQVAAVGGR